MLKPAELARMSVEEFVRTGKKISPPEELPPEMEAKAGVFICIKKKGNLRGCVGTFMPCTEKVAEEIISNAIAAANDSRFSPVSESELKR